MVKRVLSNLLIFQQNGQTGVLIEREYSSTWAKQKKLKYIYQLREKNDAFTITENNGNFPLFFVQIIAIFRFLRRKKQEKTENNRYFSTPTLSNNQLSKSRFYEKIERSNRSAYVERIFLHLGRTKKKILVRGVRESREVALGVGAYIYSVRTTKERVRRAECVRYECKSKGVSQKWSNRSANRENILPRGQNKKKILYVGSVSPEKWRWE